MDLRIEKLVNFACEYFGIKESELYSHMTNDKYSIARYVIWYELHVNQKFTIRKIREEFFRKDDTIYKGIAKMKCLLKNKIYRDMYDKFIEEFNKKATL